MEFNHKPIKVFSEVSGKQKRKFGIFNCEVCNKELKITIYDAKKKKNIYCMSCSSKNSYHKIKEKFNNKKYNNIEYKTRLYGIWSKIKSRCYNDKNDKYDYYGKRGITVHELWSNDFLSFKKWALENGYEDDLTIDRIDVNGNYEPSNCRWVNRKIQSRNTRKLRKNNTSGFRGVSKHQNGYIVQITVNSKSKYIGFFKDLKFSAIAYDTFIIINDLEHTKNFEYKNIDSQQIDKSWSFIDLVKYISGYANVQIA